MRSDLKGGGQHILSNLLVAEGVQLGSAGGHDLVRRGDIGVSRTTLLRELRDGLVVEGGGGSLVVRLVLHLGLQDLALELQGLGIALFDGVVAGGVGGIGGVAHCDVDVLCDQDVGGGEVSGGRHDQFSFSVLLCDALFLASNFKILFLN